VNNSNSVLGSGYKSFPWKVEFKSPSGEIFATAEDVLKAISGEDGDTNTTHQAALAVGKSQPPVTNPQGISFPRSSHGGSGKRLPGVKEHGLEQDVEILRAALWKASDDQVHASSPVKLRRLEAETEGYERSPMQLAPPGKGFVESCGDVVTLKVIDYDNDGDDSDDEEGRMLFSESEYDTDGEDLERRGRRRRRRREDAHHNHHQDAFDGYFYEDEEEDDDVVVADEIVNIRKEENKKEEQKEEEEKSKVLAYDDESENKNPSSFEKVKSIKKERKVKEATFYAANNGDGPSAFEKEEDFHQSEEKKLRMAQLNETKMKHSYHSSKLLKLESEPPLVSKFDDEDAIDAFFLRKEEEEEEEAVQNPTTRQQSSVIGGSQRHFVVPPRSPFGLLEEILWRDDWKLLTACMMLNCTTRLQVDRVLWELFTLAPTAEDAVKLGETERGIELIEKCLATIGLHRKRARAFVRLSKDVVEARRGKESALLRLGGESKLGDKDQILALDNNTTTGSENDDDDGNGNGERDDEEEEEEEATIPPPSSAPPTGGKFVRSVSEFHGVGAYAADAHAMFCDGIIAAPPRDHALRWYYAFALERESEKLSKNVLFLKTTNAEEEEENVERD
jgi:methyl-CpG-binding domain protein 4